MEPSIVWTQEESKGRISIFERLFNFEEYVLPPTFNRRYATRCPGYDSPWVETHGYRHGLAPRGAGRGATL